MSNYHIRQQINIQINQRESDNHKSKHPGKHRVSFIREPEMVTLPISITDTPVLCEYVPEKKSHKASESMEMESIPSDVFTAVPTIKEYTRPPLLKSLVNLVKGLLTGTSDNNRALPEFDVKETGLTIRQETDVDKGGV